MQSTREPAPTNISAINAKIIVSQNGGKRSEKSDPLHGKNLYSQYWLKYLYRRREDGN